MHQMRRTEREGHKLVVVTGSKSILQNNPPGTARRAPAGGHRQRQLSTEQKNL